MLLAWENEAFLAVNELGKGQFDIVVPSVSIRADPPVALVDANVDKHGTRNLAQAYLEFFYTKPAQEIAAKHYFRPRDPQILAANRSRFPDRPLATISDFGGWSAAQATYFADGGLFDQVYVPSK